VTSARWLNLLYALDKGRPSSPAHNTIRLEEGDLCGTALTCGHVRLSRSLLQT
jgi:hypothetical protein